MYDAQSLSFTGGDPYEVVIKEVDPLGYESSISIPVVSIPNHDGTDFLHKAAARALLGDLEFRESWIQMHPNAPRPGSDEEIGLTREHGEELGCTWGLVSKWTSFYVETASGPSNLGDGFLDGLDETHTRRSEDNRSQTRNDKEGQNPQTQYRDRQSSGRSEMDHESKKSSERTMNPKKSPTAYRRAQDPDITEERDDSTDLQGSATNVYTSENNGLWSVPDSSPVLPTQHPEATRSDTWAESYNEPSNLGSEDLTSLDSGPQIYTDPPATTDRNHADGTHGDSGGFEYPTTSSEHDFATPCQPHEYIDSASQPNQQYYAESPYSTLHDQAPAEPEPEPEPEPVVRSDLNIKVPSFGFSNPPTLSAMLDVSSKRQEKEKEKEKREHKHEFDMAERLIKIVKWDGSFPPEDTRRLLGNDWFDGISTNLSILDDSGLIATIAVLVVLRDESYCVCEQMLGPLKEKANEFVWKIIKDEGYWNDVFDAAYRGYVLERGPPWKQTQTQDAHVQGAGYDTATREHGAESAEIGVDGHALDPAVSGIYDESADQQNPSIDPWDVTEGSNGGTHASQTAPGINREAEVIPKQSRHTKAPGAFDFPHTDLENRHRGHQTQHEPGKHRYKDVQARDKKSGRNRDHKNPRTHDGVTYATEKRYSNKPRDHIQRDYDNSVSTELDGAPTSVKPESISGISTSGGTINDDRHATDASQAPTDATYGSEEFNTHDQRFAPNFGDHSGIDWQYRANLNQSGVYDTRVLPSAPHELETSTADQGEVGASNSSHDQKIDYHHRGEYKDYQDIPIRTANTKTTSAPQPVTDSSVLQTKSSSYGHDSRRHIKDRDGSRKNPLTGIYRNKPHVDTGGPEQWNHPPVHDQDYDDYKASSTTNAHSAVKEPSSDSRLLPPESNPTSRSDYVPTTDVIRNQDETYRNRRSSSGRKEGKHKATRTPHHRGLMRPSYQSGRSDRGSTKSPQNDQYNNQHHRPLQQQVYDHSPEPQQTDYSHQIPQDRANSQYSNFSQNYDPQYINPLAPPPDYNKYQAHQDSQEHNSLYWDEGANAYTDSQALDNPPSSQAMTAVGEDDTCIYNGVQESQYLAPSQDFSQAQHYSGQDYTHVQQREVYNQYQDYANYQNYPQPQSPDYPLPPLDLNTYR